MFDVAGRRDVAKYLFLFLSEPDNSVEIVDDRMILLGHCHHSCATQVDLVSPTQSSGVVVSPKEVFMNAEAAAIPRRRSARIHK